MLGSRAEAEDILQEAYLRWHQADRQTIENPEAWLVTTTTRLAIDRLRRLKTEREAYVGPWLPEPIVAPAPPPDHDVDLAEDLSIAFLTLLERLAPDERAAFLLHDVFDVGYPAIAPVLGKSDAACRQIVHRARERVRGERKRFEASDAAKRRLLQTFMTAARSPRRENAARRCSRPTRRGRPTAAARLPPRRVRFLAPNRSSKLILGLREKFWAVDRVTEIGTVNGEPGLWIHDGGHPVAAMAIETNGQQILNVYAVVNPEKLAAAVTTDSRGAS